MGAQRDRFAESFRAAAAHIQVSPEATGKATAALLEIYDVYHPNVTHAPVAAPYFAEHGENHGVRLAEIATRLIRTQVKPGVEARDFAHVRTLVIVYASFLLHDIGMSIPPPGDSVRQMHEDQSVRFQHDERSLEFIETELIAKYRNFAGWSSFWGDREIVGHFPSPEGMYAFIALARVSKSHGDSSAEWLQDNSLDSYTFRTGSQQEVRFPDDWGDQWSAVSGSLYAAATFLSLCDPCDFGSARFTDVSDRWSELILPANPAARAWSAMHLISHQVSSLDVLPDRVEAKINGYGPTKWAFLLAVYCGAVADLMRWANAPIMLERMRELVNPDFQGATVSQSVKNDVLWRQIGERLHDEFFRICWPMREINARLAAANDEDDPFPAHQAISMIFMALAKGLKEDIEETEQYLFYRLLVDLMEKGLLIDQLVKVSDPAEPALAELMVEEESASDARVTRFLGAVALVRSLLFASPTTHYDVRFAAHGTETFKLLLNGALRTCHNTIFFCEVRRPQPGDADNYKRIIDRIGQNLANNVRVIFVGHSVTDVYPEAGAYVTRIPVESDRALVAALADNPDNWIRYGEGVEAALTPAISPSTEPSLVSAGRLINELWRRGAGLDGYITSITQGLTEHDHGAYWQAASNLALVTLIDVLATSASVPIGEIATEYEKFRLRFGAERLATWDTLARSIPDEMFDADRSSLLLPQGLIDATDFEPSERLGGTGWLMQLVASSAIASGSMFNPQSAPVRGVPVTSARAKVIVDRLLQAGDDDFALVRLGIAMSDFFGRQLVREGRGFSWFSGLFAAGDFSMSVSDCLAFQMSFRVARHCMDQSAFDFALPRPAAMSVTLGVLEATCRAARIEGGLSPEAGALVTNILEDIERRPKGKGQNAAIVAFDILAKYGADTPSLIRHCERFMAPRMALRWGELADIFHNRVDPGEDRSIKRIAGYRQWSLFRTNFQFVLQNTDAELRRNAPPVPLDLETGTS